jgi:uncharacterized protein (TIGR00369 family)
VQDKYARHTMAETDSPDIARMRQMLSQGFARSAFVNDVGIQFLDCGPGWCEAGLALAPRHLQHTQSAHAGVITTLADHCAGVAAQSLAQPGEYVLTVEFKQNLLRPASCSGQGERLLCRATVLKPGKAFHVVESEVFLLSGDDKRTLVAKLTATLAVVRPS